MASPDDKNSPLISFIVTDYNLSVPLLWECIDSILAVDMKPEEREIILVDDGSDVSPWDDLSYCHAHVTYVRQENKGLSAARNTGLERASGRFIQFVDGDDSLIKDGYDRVLAEVRRADSGGKTDIVMFSHTRKSAAYTNGFLTPGTFRKTTGRKFLEKKNLRAAAWGYAFRREILGDLRFVPGIYHEDEAFTPRLFLRCGNVLYGRIKAYFYRMRPDSITYNSSPEHVAKRLDDITGTLLELRRESLAGDEAVLTRRVNQLAMDVLYQIMKALKDKAHLERYVKTFRDNGLLPLPLRTYTPKYLAFAILTQCTAGRRILYKYINR